MARIGDLPAVVSTLRGKVEFEVSEEVAKEEILEHLARRAVAESFRAHLGGVELSALIERDSTRAPWSSPATSISARSLLDAIGPIEGLGRIVTALEARMAESPPDCPQPASSWRWKDCG